MSIDERFAKIVFEKTYQDTLSLLLRSEAFLKIYSQRPLEEKSPNFDLRINCEMTRVTARVSQVMTWLLAQKAAYAGEITFDEANAPRYRLDEDPFCMTDSLQGQEEFLPLPVKDLLTDSFDLYRRVLNLAHPSYHQEEYKN